MGRLAYITYLDGRGDSPDNSLPGGWSGRPDNSLPGGGWSGRPDNSLPGVPPHGVTLPVFPFDPTLPDNTLPGSQPEPDNELPGRPSRPDNSLPGYQPIVPGAKFVVKWLACQGLILVPDNSLPTTPAPKK